MNATEVQFVSLLRQARVHTHTLRDDGSIPNNPRLPILIYEGALALSGTDSASTVLQLLETNGWQDGWVNGIYSYHHYHSTAHEVLAVVSGLATVQFGGELGIKEQLQAGDVVAIPAGVAHKNLGSTSDFKIVGAYPAGQQWDMCYGKSEERPKSDENIDRVPLPESDPIYGLSGPLVKYWVE
jgi:uncharacterized protein YjlB